MHFRLTVLLVMAMQHETCDMNTFRSGAGDRGASIRIPLPVEKKGYGYLEDRRPSANVDPYTVARLLIKVCHRDVQVLWGSIKRFRLSGPITFMLSRI